MPSRVLSELSMKTAFALAALLIGAAPLCTAPLAAPPVNERLAASVAIVSDATGDAFIVSPRRIGDSPVRVLSELFAGQTLRLEPGCRLVISLTATGQTFELEGGGRFRIEADSIEALDRVGRLRPVLQGLGLRMLS
jgi:hypothetical protein